MGIGVVLWRGKSLMENPCSSGIALGRDGKTTDGMLLRSKGLHLVSRVGSPYPNNLCFITLEPLLARASKIQEELKTRCRGLEIVHLVWRR